MSNSGTCCCGTEASLACGCTRPGTCSRASVTCNLQSSRLGWTGTRAWTDDWSSSSLGRRACLSDVGCEGFPGTAASPASGWSTRFPGTREWWSCWVAVLHQLHLCWTLITCGWARRPERRQRKLGKLVKNVQVKRPGVLKDYISVGK